ncbi:dynein regulatory complex protein 9-like [Microplitis mediator]|uniref:dynein regulatory complex protein 9-like n=1 Tax=Microplitis mediator TaxID=375433 RepID=UPI00255477BF|nr:dynein regulatory complex protein 9-like [Microplitis mediator]
MEQDEKKVTWMPAEDEETIPIRSYSDQKRKSSIAFKEIFTTTDEQLREKFVDINEFENEVNMEKKSMEKLSVSLSKSMGQLSKIKAAEIGDSKSKRIPSSVSIPPIGRKKSLSSSQEPSIQSLIEITKSSEVIKNRERGTTRRSTLTFNVGTLGIFSGNEVHLRVSDNIPVRNMALDVSIVDTFDYKTANAFVDIIERMLDKLQIIKYTIPVSVNDWDESFKSMEENYGDIKYEECGFDNKDLEDNYIFEKLVAEKLQRDRTYIYNVLEKTMKELKSENSYDYLKKEIDDIVKISEDQYNLEINNEIWSEQLKQLRELIDIEKINNQLQVKAALSDIKRTCVNIENIINNSTWKLDFVERWEESRLKQQKLLLEIKEQILNDELSEYTKREKSDEIISGELITFFQSEIIEMEKQIEDWGNRYSIEINELQQEIDEEKEKINNVKEILEEKTKLCDEQKVVIDEYENERAEKIKKSEYLVAINRAATIIQAAWRGYMVRKELGSYKNLWNVLKKRKKLALKKKNKRNVKIAKKKKKLKA